MDLTAKSLTELNAMTKAQIVAALTEDRTETKVTFQDGDRRGMLRQVVETAGKVLEAALSLVFRRKAVPEEMGGIAQALAEKVPEGIAALQSMSSEQLFALTTNQFAKAILSDKQEALCAFQEGDKRGMLKQVWETRDWQGNLMNSRETAWTYWPAGNVRDITIIEKDGQGKETSSQVVKHAESGGLANGTLD
jgi:hypothetical protein